MIGVFFFVPKSLRIPTTNSNSAKLFEMSTQRFARDLKPLSDIAELLSGGDFRGAQLLWSNLTGRQKALPVSQKLRAAILTGLGHYSQANGLYRDLTVRFPGDPEILLNFSNCLMQQSRPSDAINIIEKALAQAPCPVRTHDGDRVGILLRKNMALCYASIGKTDDAITVLKALRRVCPRTDTFPVEQLAALYNDLGDTPRFGVWLKRAYRDKFLHVKNLKPTSSPRSVTTTYFDKLIEASLGDPIYVENNERFERRRNQLLLDERLLALTERLSLEFLENHRSLFLYITLRLPRFYLAYSQLDDKEVNERWTKILKKWIEPLSHGSRTIAQKKRSNGFKVAVVSEQFGLHVSKWPIYFLERLARSTPISISVIALNCDPNAVRIEKTLIEPMRVRYTLDESSFEQVISDLIKQDFDFIFYPDVGMTGSSRLFASIRLARKQVVFWGHPITTGSTAIDIFLSSDLMEVEDSQRYYTEKLVKLPNFGLYLPTPKADFETNISSVLSERRASYENPTVVMLQSLWKLLPEHDDLFEAVLLVHDRVSLKILLSPERRTNEKFVMRLAKNNNIKRSIDIGRIQFIDRTRDVSAYLRLVRAAHLSIDSLGWSGGNTYLDCVSQLTPVLTSRGQSMRANHTFAGNKLLGLEGLNFSGKSTLKDGLKDLLHNWETYRTFVELLFEGRHALYEDERVLRAFEELVLAE